MTRRPWPPPLTLTLSILLAPGAHAPANQRCGVDYADANRKCGTACPENTSEECPHGEDCWSDLDTPGPCDSAESGLTECRHQLEVMCAKDAGGLNSACSVCHGMDSSGSIVLPPQACIDRSARPALTAYCADPPPGTDPPAAGQPCQWWVNRHFAYGGVCVQHSSSCHAGAHGTKIPGETLNHQLPHESRVCAGGYDCCVQTFPSETLVPLQGTTLPTPIVKHPNCAVMDTDGARPPYVNFNDDHQAETSLPGLDSTIHAYAVIPCADEQKAGQQSGIRKGTTARITNRRTISTCLTHQSPYTMHTQRQIDGRRIPVPFQIYVFTVTYLQCAHIYTNACDARH